MKKSISIIGGGPAALMIASQLDENKFDVTIYERNPALGRKFLVAGDGGFNLTHSEEIELFISRYTPSSFFEKIISEFSNTDLRNWFASIGIETLIGSSKRVFPINGIKPIDVLNALLNDLKKKNVSIKTNHKWIGWKNDNLIFSVTLSGAEGQAKEEIVVSPDITIFALGGGSWKVTGSDGSWTTYFSEKGIELIPFYSSNCAYEIKWKKEFIALAEGKSLKNIAISCKSKIKKGEVVITKFGLEGGAIYALSPEIRKQLKYDKEAEIVIDLKPHLSYEQIRDKFSTRGNRSIKKLLVDRLTFLFFLQVIPDR